MRIEIKRVIRNICVLGIVVALLSGCGTDTSASSKAGSSNSVEDTINSQMSADSASSTDSTGSTDSANVADAQNLQSDAADGKTSANGVDYDLTEMGSEMIYATVYQMMIEPQSYVGKTVRMQGVYSMSFSDSMDTRYHFCIIQDATACCAQGIEFVWGDGSHVYPDEYPEDGTEIVVEGVFETYTEEGDSNVYCRLKDATLQVE